MKYIWYLFVYEYACSYATALKYCAMQHMNGDAQHSGLRTDAGIALHKKPVERTAGSMKFGSSLNGDTTRSS
jgi:hypothetical protein